MYRTLKGPAQDEFTEKRSRFIDYASPVTNEEEALAFLEQIRARHRDATHNVYAYVLRDGLLQRFSDDGEPQGTAGIPVLEVILKSGITDCAVVVTRYFGGTLLGAGGLVRAYSHAARLAIEKAGISEMRLCRILEITVDYTLYGKLQYWLAERQLPILETNFAESVCLSVLMPSEELESVKAGLLELTAAAVVLTEKQEIFCDFESEKRKN